MPRVGEVWQLASAVDQELVDEAVFRGHAFVDVDLCAQSAKSTDFEQCRFSKTSIAGSVLERATFVDCIVEHCDWSNTRAVRSSMVRVDVSSSRLTGLHWVDGGLRDVAVRECRMDLSVFRYTIFNNVAFVGCNLNRADFTSADLRGASFTDCDLSAAQFAQANAVGTRFTRCELTWLGNVTSLRGAVVSGQDLAALSRALATALGIVIDGD